MTIENTKSTKKDYQKWHNLNLLPKGIQMFVKRLFILNTLLITTGLFPMDRQNSILNTKEELYKRSAKKSFLHQLKKDPRCIECNREFKSHVDFYEHVQKVHLNIDDKTILKNEEKPPLIKSAHN